MNAEEYEDAIRRIIHARRGSEGVDEVLRQGWVRRMVLGHHAEGADPGFAAHFVRVAVMTRNDVAELPALQPEEDNKSESETEQ